MRWMAASRSWFCGTIQPLACSAFQIASPFLAAERVEDRGFCDVGGQRAEPLAGGEVEEVAQQASGAEPRVVLVVAQAL